MRSTTVMKPQRDRPSGTPWFRLFSGATNKNDVVKGEISYNQWSYEVKSV